MCARRVLAVWTLAWAISASMVGDSVAQLSIIQNQYSPEFGHSSGGQFNQVITSGTNSFHGKAYEYLQNRNLKALDASTVRQLQAAKLPLSTQRYDSNRLGATVGGPIIKNRLFYFGNFEYSPTGYASPGLTTSSAPTAVAF